MINAWVIAEKGLARFDGPIDKCMPDAVVWLDLVDISKEEELTLEQCLGIDIPTRAEMQELEVSSRLYREGATVYMTSNHLIKTETENPEISPVTFVLSKRRLITIRYAEPWSFRAFAQRAPKSGANTAELAFVGLMETTVERLADMLEIVSVELEHVSQRVFSRSKNVELDLQRVIQKIGVCGNISGKARESLLDKNRVITFAEQATHEWIDGESMSRLRAAQHDIIALSDHATFTSGKVNFLLDATLGLISIDQNRVIKIFSIAAVIFMPPTLIASIYGMNFHIMPELKWHFGYPFALALMLCSVISTLWVFRRQRWL